MGWLVYVTRAKRVHHSHEVRGGLGWCKWFVDGWEWYNGANEKPPSEREGDRVSGGRSLRDFGFVLTLLSRALPHPTPSGAFGPGRKHSLLPALAKKMPRAYFLNASRPPGGSLGLVQP